MSSLQNIETFAEVATCLSFAEAARRLKLPPSTVTSRVRALEESLGVRLLDRTTRRAALTAEGAVFLERCQSALTEIEDAMALVSPESSASGLVRLSVPAAFPMAQLAGHIRRFLEQNPQASLQVSVDDRPADFVRDGIDLALRGSRPGSEGLITRLLSRTPVVLAAPPGRLDDASLPVLGPLARGLGRPRDPGRAYCESFELARQLVLAGIARACLPLKTCEADSRDGTLELAPPPDGVESTLALYLVYQDRRHLPQRVRLLKDFLIETLSKTNAPADS
ncbi:MAG: LysR family transcriptional regulator [Rhodobacteraceae bacterium]|nr:LysR family transcriptional regulator [Paracoccaceae bacterium]